jgi:hypothetical protein
VRRWMVPLVVAALALPASAAAKQGVMFSPQLFGLPAGATTRLELYVLPVCRAYREIGTAGGLSVYRADHQTVPAPRVGSVPVVILHEVGGTESMRFVGTALDQDLRSIVNVAVPPSAASKRWVVSVRASGHVYPDLTGPPLTTTANLPTASLAIDARHAGGRERSEGW